MPSPLFGFPDVIGINPNAPPPLSQGRLPVLRSPGLGQGGGGGLGLGGILGSIFGGGRQQQPQTQQPQAPQDAQPSARTGNPLAEALLNIGDVTASIQGVEGPRAKLLAQRRQEYEQKRQAFVQNLALLDKLGETLQNTPVDQVEAKKAKLREAYAQFPGADPDTFDTFLGDTGLSKAMIEMANRSEGAKMILAQGGSLKDLNDFFRSPAGRAEAIEIQDTTALPSVQRKLTALLNSSDPDVRAELAKIAKDGSTTAAELKTLFERFGTEGPEGTKLTPGELGTYERKQDVLAQLVPGFKADKAFAKEKEAKASADLEVQTQKRIATDAGEIRARLEAEKAKNAPREGATPNKQVDVFSTAQQRSTPFRKSIAALDRALDARVGGIKDIEQIFQFISGLDETAAREGEVALAQKAAGLKGKVQSLLEQARGTGIVGDEIRVQLSEALKATRDDIAEELNAVVTGFREVADASGTDPRIVAQIDALGKFEEPKAAGKQAGASAETRSATDAEIEAVQRELGENASEDQILDALAAKGLQP